MTRASTKLPAMKRSTLIALAILMLLTGGLGFYLYQNLESYEKSENTGPSLKAIMNPWLAAQRFLERHHVESHRSHDLQSILDRLKVDETLVLFNDTAVYNTTSQQKLEAWMQNGGHLIITANYEWDEEENASGDPFLDRFGVRMKWIGAEEEDGEEEDEDTLEDDSVEEADATSTAEDAEVDVDADTDVDNENPADADESLPASPDETAPADTASAGAAQSVAPASGTATPAATPDDNCAISETPQPFKISLEELDKPVLINFGYSYTLEDASGNAIGQADNWPNSLLQYQVGKGMMTVLLDTDIWDNQHIGDFDHAYLLWYLAANSPNVWLVVNSDSEDLLTLLWRNAKYWMIGLAGMLLIWGWRRWVRFGPLIPDPVADRRQLLEHIQAEATFSWQHKQLEPLLKSVREHIWQRLSQQHGIQNHSPDQHDIALHKLAEITQQDAAKVRHAMTCPVPAKELHWIELISLLQTIRNAL